jgi:hypothetical protein
MKKVILESPYAGDVARNLTYARRALRDSLLRGEAPLASHLLYTQDGVLDDAVPSDRALGIKAGFAWHKHAESAVVYADYGLTPGMLKGIQIARDTIYAVEFRLIGKNGEALSYEADLNRLQDQRARVRLEFFQGMVALSAAGLSQSSTCGPDEYEATAHALILGALKVLA